VIPRESTFFPLLLPEEFERGDSNTSVFLVVGVIKEWVLLFFTDGALGWHTYPPCSSSSEDKFLVHYEQNMMCLKVLQLLINLTFFLL
jgi:hypothetical protein